MQGEQWPGSPVVDPSHATPGYDDALDPHHAVFGLGADEHGDGTDGGPDGVGGFAGPARSRGTRRAHAARARRRRRGRLAVLVLVVLLLAGAAIATMRLVGDSGPSDYTGSGFGTVRVSIAPGDTAGDIADTLYKAGVVKSADAFVAAAKADPRSTGLQPGTYVVHHHMSGASALRLLLDPASRDAASDTVVTEGATVLDVRAALLRRLGPGAAAAIDRALARPQDLTLPGNYSPAGGDKLSSLEGFLYPATYTFGPSSKPADDLQAMVTKFTAEDRRIGFAAQASRLQLTPYEALIVASIAQSEARFAEDMPKVVRTILNRLRYGRPLQFDSTSSYACKLQHVQNCIYDQIDSPYNTYRNHGLPPTPIDNPGEAALRAAVNPADGNWLYFVNKDAAGHLFFTDSETAFAKAAAKCRAEHWGCG